ncbi:MAG: Rne/Rng family ribonuclease [candidate division WOR-3 bacterium]
MKVKKEIILASSDSEIRIAILEDSQLVEFFIEHDTKSALVGRIYKGIVENVVKGLRGAFVNLGLKKNGFLPLADIPELEAFDESKLEIEPEDKKPVSRELSISPGQEILCQVTKEPLGEKGVRVTSYISLAGRNLVYFPSVPRIGISRRIRDRKTRTRLRALAKQIKKRDVGLIIRTSAENATDDEIRNEYRALEIKWAEIQARANQEKAPTLLYDESDIITQIVRDLFTHDVESLIVDSEEKYKEIIDALKIMAPSLIPRVSLYRGEVPIFEHYGIEEQLNRALERRIWLKSGGFITIDQTEALVAIDVNSGRFAQEEDPERLILQTNLEAASEIARQIRLRDLSGLIIIDFIDMKEQKNMDIVVRELKMCLENDRAKADFAKVSRFGILEMTRERIRPSLLHTLCEVCPVCKGLGRVLSRTEIAMKIERTLYAKSQQLTGQKVKIMVAPQNYEFLLSEREEQLSEIAKKYKLALEIKPDNQIPITEFKIYIGT